MSVLLQSLAIIICLIMLLGVFQQMKRQRMTESKALVWILGVVGLLILSCFPGILMWIAGLLGISWAPAALIFFALLAIAMNLFYQIMTVSELEAQMKEIAMQVAILREENEVLKQTLNEMQNERE